MKVKNKIITIAFTVFLVGMMLFSVILPDIAVSVSERRKLAQLPDFTFEKLWNGKYFSELEDYSLDQFPGRDVFRSLKAYFRKYIMGQSESNNIIIKNNAVYKLEYPLNEKALTTAAERYNKVVQTLFSNNDVNLFYTLVPDKNYYAADEYGFPAIDYEKMYALMQSTVQGMEYIDIRDLLTLDSYYRTDLHWDQSKILPVADRILTAMGKNPASQNSFTQNTIYPFNGSYYGQAAMPSITPDTLTYLTNSVIEGAVVYDIEDGTEKPVYKQDALSDVDTYDAFLHGARALLKIMNPANTSGKKLFVIRDSFGSSLTPLMISEYSEIDVIDLRYISLSVINNFIDVTDGSDVLFMCGTLVLNQYGVIIK